MASLHNQQRLQARRRWSHRHPQHDQQLLLTIPSIARVVRKEPSGEVAALCIRHGMTVTMIAGINDIASSRAPHHFVSDLATLPALRSPVVCAGTSWHRSAPWAAATASAQRPWLHEAGVPCAWGQTLRAPAHKSRRLHEQAYSPMQAGAGTGSWTDSTGARQNRHQGICEVCACAQGAAAAGHLTCLIELIRRKACAHFQLDPSTEAVPHQDDINIGCKS